MYTHIRVKRRYGRIMAMEAMLRVLDDAGMNYGYGYGYGFGGGDDDGGDIYTSDEYVETVCTRGEVTRSEASRYAALERKRGTY